MGRRGFIRSERLNKQSKMADAGALGRSKPWPVHGRTVLHARSGIQNSASSPTCWTHSRPTGIVPAELNPRRGSPVFQRRAKKRRRQVEMFHWLRDRTRYCTRRPAPKSCSTPGECGWAAHQPCLGSDGRALSQQYLHPLMSREVGPRVNLGPEAPAPAEPAGRTSGAIARFPFSATQQDED